MLIFNHLRLWIAVAGHNLKWLKILINQPSRITVKEIISQIVAILSLWLQINGGSSSNRSVDFGFVRIKLCNYRLGDWSITNCVQYRLTRLLVFGFLREFKVCRWAISLINMLNAFIKWRKTLCVVYNTASALHHMIRVCRLQSIFNFL